MLPSVFCLLFYAAAFGLLTAVRYWNVVMRETIDASALYLSSAFSGVLFLLLGFLTAYLAGRKKGSYKTLLLELAVIGILSLWMASVCFLFGHADILVPDFVSVNLSGVAAIGSVLLGCELFRLIFRR